MQVLLRDGATLHDSQRPTNILRQGSSVFFSLFFRRGTHGGWRRACCRNACFLALSDQNVSICSSTFTSQAPKMLLSTKVPKPIEKQKQQKNKKFHPMPPVQLLRPSLNGWKLFWGVFSRFLPLCQSNNVSCSFFGVVFSCFLGSWEKCSP